MFGKRRKCVEEENGGAIKAEIIQQREQDMIKTNLKVEQSEKKGKQLGKAPLNLPRKENAKEEKFIQFLNTFYESEQSFTKNAKIIAFIFNQLYDHYPAESLFEQYDRDLKMALPHFESLSTDFKTIVQDPTLEGINKIEQIAALYCSDPYYQSLSHFILLHKQFERWGGEFEYEKWIRETHLFSADIMQETHGIYSPIIFIQRLPQLALMVQELIKLTADLKIQALGNAIKGKIEAIHARKRKIEALEEISYLLSQESEGDVEEIQKKIIQIFIENRLYLDPEPHEVHQKIKKYYSRWFQEILKNLFKQIEELKIKIQKKPSEQLKIFNSELKERVLRYIEYSEEYACSLIGFEPWTHLASIVLAEAPLTSVALISYIGRQPDNKKLLLMKCFADFLLFIKEHGDEGMVQENQEAMELMLQR